MKFVFRDYVYAQNRNLVQPNMETKVLLTIYFKTCFMQYGYRYAIHLATTVKSLI